MEALDTAAAGDALLLQASCHNPTGADMNLDQWRAIADLVSAPRPHAADRCGLSRLGAGARRRCGGMRLVLEAASDALVAYSCGQEFWPLPRTSRGTVSRCPAAPTGLRWWPRTSGDWRGQAGSMPPDHGAAIVRVILESEVMTEDWRAELEAMRHRLVDVRRSPCPGAACPGRARRPARDVCPASARSRSGLGSAGSARKSTWPGSGRSILSGLTPGDGPGLRGSLCRAIAARGVVFGIGPDKPSYRFVPIELSNSAHVRIR